MRAWRETISRSFLSPRPEFLASKLKGRVVWTESRIAREELGNMVEKHGEEKGTRQVVANLEVDWEGRADGDPGMASFK
jgi:hypothetical protein